MSAFLVVAAMLALTACGMARPRPPPSPPPTAVAQPEGTAPALPSPAVPPVPGAAALNSRIFSRVSSPLAETDLPIGPGDLIEVSVFEVEELSKLKLRVPMRGSVTLPLLGQIPAAGRTAIELEDEIRTRLQQRYMHDPQVSVFVHEQRSQRISVIGAVRKGGVYPLTSRLRLADALATADGLADEADHMLYLIRRVPASELRRALSDPEAGPGTVTVRPPTPGESTEEVTIPIDLEALASGKEELNVALAAGDVIHVPRAGSVYVGGSVGRPGSLLLRTRMTVEQAILAAGGVQDVADWNDIRVYRAKPGGEREVVRLSFNEFEQGKPAPEVQKNDVIIVGKSGLKAFWYGFLSIFGIGTALPFPVSR